MCKIFLATCFLLTAMAARLPLQAQQQHEVDSILNVLRDSPNDTTKVLGFYQLSYIYNYIQYKTELARKYVDSARQLSENLNYRKGVVESHYYYGLIDLNESSYPPALDHFSQYIDYHKSRGDSLNVGKALYCVGIVYNNLGETNKNLAIQLRALTIYERTNDKSKISHTLSSIAGAYMK